MWILGRSHGSPCTGIDAALSPRGLHISVVAAIGLGQTPLSAFDRALWQVDVHNYNLLPLSSVIPPGSEVVVAESHEAPPDEFGHKLHVVKAEMRSATPGAVIGAGVGWLQWTDGRGVFVEHELESTAASCETVKKTLACQITTSLHDLAAVRQVEFVEENVGSRIVVTRVGVQPACALVLALYESEGW